MSPIEYYAAMYGAYQAMPENEKADLHAWERGHIDGSGKIGTSDWPGWEKYIGKPPWTNSALASDERQRIGFVYLMYAKTGEYKIGSSINPSSRIKGLSVGLPAKLELIHTFPADDMKQAERTLHEKFANKMERSEWFR
jgi:hypothetical protein